MSEYLSKVFSQIKEFVKNLSLAKKISLVGLTLGIIAGITVMMYWASNTTFETLMTNLAPEDSANIIRILRDKNIPFKVDQSGKNISIPPENVYELRLELATIGLPQASVVGYEVFDKQPMGTTSFVQRVNRRRAQEGELMRTINTIKGVRRSRVHLAIPEKSAFVEDQKAPSASVVVDLEPGSVLADKQVFGIGNLVARAVEGLDITDVVIMNSEGKVLSKNPDDPLAAATATQFDFQQKLQRDMEGRIETMLSRIVGEGHVVAKVTADLDFSQVDETQTIFDADGAAVRSVEKRNSSMTGKRPSPYGAAGNQFNAPGANVNPSGQVTSDTSKTNEVTNYEVPQTVRRTRHSMGAVRKLSVAVVVDSKVTKTKQEDGSIVTNAEPWTDEKMAEFRQIASSAVGLNDKRGDTLEISNIEFTREDFEEAQRFIAAKETKDYIQNMVMYAVIGLAIALFFMFVVRPFIKWVTENTIDSVDTFLPQTIEELEKVQKNTALPVIEEVVPVLPENLDPAKVEGEMIKEKIITLIETNPHKAALILKDWLHQDKKAREADAARRSAAG